MIKVKVKTIFGIKSSKSKQVIDADSGPAPSVSDGAVSASASISPEDNSTGDTLRVAPTESATSYFGVDAAMGTQLGRFRSDSLSKLMQAVQSPMRRPRAKTLSETDLSNNGSGNNQQIQDPVSDVRRRPRFRGAAMVSEGNGMQLARLRISKPGNASEGNSPLLTREETCYFQAGLTTFGLPSQDGQKFTVRTPSVIHEKPKPRWRPPTAYPRGPSDRFADLLDRSEFCSPVITRFNDALARGDSLNEFCQPFALPFTSLLALPCPPQRIRQQTLHRWSVVSLLLVAALGFLCEAAILLRVLIKYQSASANVDGVLLSTWIIIGATFCACYFLLAFWTQVDWAYGKRTTAILFPKRLLLV